MQYVFEYEDKNVVRTVEIDGEVWFVLADVCRALELHAKNGSFSHHSESLDQDEKRLIARADIERARPSPLKREGLKAPIGASLLAISESGLYALVLSSRKPEAKRFKRWVTHEVLPQIRRTGFYASKGIIPHVFVRRFNDNWHRTERGYFSVISELYIRLYGRFEQVGHILAEKAQDGHEIRPDVSVGKLFSKWLKAKRPTKADAFKMYMHLFPNGLEFEARQYENALLPAFIEFLDSEWIPNCEEYLRSRDPAALAHLPKLLGGNVRRHSTPVIRLPGRPRPAA